MLYSMTGYGYAKKSFARQTLSAELRSLNSKSLDLRLRLPAPYQPHEHDLRKWVQEELERGKIDLSVQMESGEWSDFKINQPLLEAYVYQLLEVAGMNGWEKGDVLQTAARLPNVVQSNEQHADEEFWAQLQEVIKEAMAAFLAFRQREGASMTAEITQRVGEILRLLDLVTPFEGERMERVRARLRTQLEQMALRVDENRFEQELIFYMEKFDFSEEQQRLRQHCVYFLELLQQPAPRAKGSKLGFIAQEIGREVNTLGSKANHAEIQHIVVQMKDELEKIKEQLANIL